jgi:hypothetical protein
MNGGEEEYIVSAEMPEGKRQLGKQDVGGWKIL